MDARRAGPERRSASVALAQDLAHDVSDNPGHVLAEVRHFLFQVVEASVDLAELLFGFGLKAKEAAVHALDLLHEESERAFKLAHAAPKIADFRLDIHGRIHSTTLWMRKPCLQSPAPR